MLKMINEQEQKAVALANASGASWLQVPIGSLVRFTSNGTEACAMSFLLASHDQIRYKTLTLGNVTTRKKSSSMVGSNESAEKSSWKAVCPECGTGICENW